MLEAPKTADSTSPAHGDDAQAEIWTGGVGDVLADVLAGDDAAWAVLIERVHPLIIAICRRRRFVGGLGDPEDLQRDVALAAIEKLRASDFVALRAFVDTRRRRATSSFVRWLAVVVSNCYVDVLRKQPEYQRRREQSERRLMRLSRETLDETRHASAGNALQQVEIRRILDVLMSELFPTDQRVAIVMWLRGNSAAEIAAELRLGSAGKADKVLHAARQRLRRAVRRGRS